MPSGIGRLTILADQFDGVARAPQSLNHEFGEADTHPVETIGALKNENSIAHCTPKRKIAASRLYGPAPAETNMISMNAYRTSGR
jgi:hypothetical protein